jgi:thioredoxin-related protein
MRKILPLLAFLFSAVLFGQSEAPGIYDPQADATAVLEQAIKQAQQENKHVLVQVGGNWCPWCVRLHNFYAAEPAVDSALKAGYVLCHINYSKENKNSAMMERLGFPQRFGFPVLVVLDGKGNRLHTQNTAYLEKEKSYDPKRMIEFLASWCPAALDPDKYRE